MKILHLEDSADDGELVWGALRLDGIVCQITRVETRKAFVEALEHPDWDLILADYSLPSFDGISALKLAVEKRPDVPFIFVTGALGEERAVETLKNGATDYVVKHRLDRLPQAVNRAIRESESARAQKQAEQDMKASLREKELLLQEVHHRVKNNLQIICSLLDMQAGVMKDQATIAALQESQKRVQSMAMIHEMLYASSSLHDIDFAEYARLLASELANSYGMDGTRVKLVFALESMRFEIDRAIPCGLILNELLSNALKYAFPNGNSGEIRISLQQRGTDIRLAVEDTGVGLPPGQEERGRKSLGLRIVKILTQQVGGSMETSSDHGAHFILTFGQSSG